MDIKAIIIKFLEMTALRMDAPEIGSAFHILSVSMLALIAVIAAVKVAHINGGNHVRLKNSDGSVNVKDGADRVRIRILFVLGLIMLAGEIYKQLFYYYIVNGETYDWWFFPFQLCSVPMYMCLLLPLFYRSGFDKVMLTFMCGFTFVSAVAALVWPEDMLRPYVALTWHGLIWHGILLFISVMIGLSGMADLTWKGFLKSVLLFLALCAVAIMINVLAEPIAASHPIYPGSAPGAGPMSDGSATSSSVAGVISYPNMFYLSPYHASLQPVICQIDASLGRIPAMLIYVAAVIIAAGLSDFAFYMISKTSMRREAHQNL